MKENEGSLIFWRWSKCSVVGCDSYHRIYIKAVVGWGDDSGAEFPFLCEQSERTECYLW